MNSIFCVGIYILRLGRPGPHPRKTAIPPDPCTSYRSRTANHDAKISAAASPHTGSAAEPQTDWYGSCVMSSEPAPITVLCARRAGVGAEERTPCRRPRPPDLRGHTRRTRQARRQVPDLQPGAEEFGTEVLKVREIMGMQDITMIPQIPPTSRASLICAARWCRSLTCA